MEKSTLNKSERSYKEKKVVQDICFQLLLNMCKNIFVYTLQLEITSQVGCLLVMLVSYIQKAGDPGDKSPPIFLDFRKIFG